MIKPTAYCDVCDTPKGQSNHWFLIFMDERGLSLYPWKDSEAGLPGMIHVCGSQHAIQKISEYLSTLPSKNQPA